MTDYTIRLDGKTLEYYDSDHVYLVDGVIVPSITQILKVKFGRKYEGIDATTLNRAAEAGTAVHDAIERNWRYGERSELPEVRNFLFLQKKHGFKVQNCEVPVILSMDGEAVAAGRLDLVIRQEENDQIGLADIKRTSSLDKEYLAYQLNLYRIAYHQCYGCWATTLHGVHLREDIRKFVPIPINEELVWSLVREWRETHE